MNRQVCIIGGGVAGMQTAAALDAIGIPSLLVEKSAALGGRLREHHRLFPYLDSGTELLGRLEDSLRRAALADVRLDSEVTRITGEAPDFSVELNGAEVVTPVAAIVAAAGFEPFDASQQEEYGYGVYRNVINGLDLERLLHPDGATGGELRRPSDGQPVRDLAIVFCVGSRNEKLGRRFCSRVCCAFSTKQAIEIKERYPETSVTCFYIDIRTYGRGFEEMYHRAQQSGVRYIRGRVAECGQLADGRITIKAENTLLNKPVRGSFDLVSLSQGMAPCRDAAQIAEMLRLERDESGFFTSRAAESAPNDSARPGVFLAGAVTGLKPIPDCITDGNAVSARIAAYLRSLD